MWGPVARLAGCTGALTAWARHASTRAGNTFNRRFRGLYGGKHIQFGNKISFSNKKYALMRFPNIRPRARLRARERSCLTRVRTSARTHA